MPPHDSQFTVDSVLEILRTEGLRITRKRTAILETLFESDSPMSLQEIQEGAAKRSGATPDFATVFRMLNLMEQLHLVHKVSLQRSSSYYELSDPRKHYDHLVCKKCDQVIIIDIPCPIGETEKKLARQYGFRDLSHSLEFFGICPACAT
jgi:Fe2+ or Zn2+ uptake regulation protein